MAARNARTYRDGLPAAGLRVLAIATLLLAVSIALRPAAASAASKNAAAVHAYIRADYALNRAGVSLIGKTEANVKHYIAELGQQCPGVGSGSLDTAAVEPMSYEVAVALIAIEYSTGAQPIAAFVRATAKLHFSSHALAARVKRYARAEHELATLAHPNLCEEVRTFKATGFSAAPAAAVSLDQHEQSIDSDAVPQSALAPYEHGSDARTVEATEELERKMEEQEFIVGQIDWYQALETLALAP